MNLNPFKKRTHGRRKVRTCALSLCLGLTLLAPLSAKAQWRTQTFDLVKGWNAVYLHVDASYTDIEDFVEGTPIKEIWFWNPSHIF